MSSLSTTTANGSDSEMRRGEKEIKCSANFDLVNEEFPVLSAIRLYQCRRVAIAALFIRTN